MTSKWGGPASFQAWLLAGSLGYCLSANATSLQCEGVTLSLDDESARANISIVEGLASDDEIDAALQLPGNLALVEKSNQSGASNTVADLRTALRAARNGTAPDPDLFGLGRLRRDLQNAKDLLALLDRDAENIISSVCARLTPYLPADYASDIDVHILAGGYATGFTFDAGTDFYLAAQRIGDDPAGLELIIVHELFHVVQTALNPLSQARLAELEEVHPLKSRALAHLFNGYREGGASWVANADNYSGTGPTISFFKEAQGKYTQQFGRLFITFEAYLYQLFNDPKADVSRIYSAGFMDDGPLYYVGFYMAREIEKEQGTEAIRELLHQPPTAFFQQYQTLCHTNEDLLCFSPTTDSIIEQAAELILWSREPS